MANGLGNLANGIWKGEPRSVAIKEVIDGVVYGRLTAGTFGWLWPWAKMARKGNPNARHWHPGLMIGDRSLNGPSLAGVLGAQNHCL